MDWFWHAFSQAAALLTGLALMAVSGCVPHRPAPIPLTPAPHYVLGEPYQADGTWYYPAEDTALDATGIATVQTPQDGLTADGERPDPSALVAAMQTIQLPVIVQVTDLDTGRQIEVRVNDRGPATPSRLIALSPRAAALLGMGTQPAARVRVQIDGAQSRALQDQLGGGPTLAIQTAPSAAITAEPLAAPGASTAAGKTYQIGGAQPEVQAPRVPDRLPEQVRLVGITPAQIWIRAGVFGRFDYANRIAATLAGLGSDVLRSRDGRETSFAVRCGPFASIAQADAALDRAIRAGVIDARITIE